MFNNWENRKFLLSLKSVKNVACASFPCKLISFTIQRSYGIFTFVLMLCPQKKKSQTVAKKRKREKTTKKKVCNIFGRDKHKISD